ncbi:MAG: hypothetical protein AMJ59_20530 [Gammaproteobacteria bacterium SG8_31]|nr:MAG: hypothetical protein AMJ59_20530 [Gammaproteobacteria bacterium SG8_31]
MTLLWLSIRRVCAGLLVVSALLTVRPAVGAEVIRAEVHHEEDLYSLYLEARLEAPPLAVFAVITDYPHIQDLHRRVRESRVLRRLDARTTEVFTLLRGCVAAIFCKSIARVERVTENPPYELVAEVLPGQSDLKSGRVHWQLRAEGEGTRLFYRSETEPDFWVPPLLGDTLMSHSIRRTTQEMIEKVEELALEKPVGGGEKWDSRQ